MCVCVSVCEKSSISWNLPDYGGWQVSRSEVSKLCWRHSNSQCFSFEFKGRKEIGSQFEGGRTKLEGGSAFFRSSDTPSLFCLRVFIQAATSYWNHSSLLFSQLLPPVSQDSNIRVSLQWYIHPSLAPSTDTHHIKISSLLHFLLIPCVFPSYLLFIFIIFLVLLYRMSVSTIGL